jgi:hypothetical protein
LHAREIAHFWKEGSQLPMTPLGFVTDFQWLNPARFRDLRDLSG